MLVERFERASVMEGTPRVLLRLGRIRQTIVGGCRLGSIGLAEDICQLEHRVGAAQLGFGDLTGVGILIADTSDVLEYFVADGDRSIVCVPELLRSLLLADLGDIAPAISLLLEGADSAPRGVVVLVAIVGVHLQQVGCVGIGISRYEELRRILWGVQLHTVVGVLVEVLTAAREEQCQRED